MKSFDTFLYGTCQTRTKLCVLCALNLETYRDIEYLKEEFPGMDEGVIRLIYANKDRSREDTLVALDHIKCSEHEAEESTSLCETQVK